MQARPYKDLRALAIFFVEFGMAIFEARQPSLDKEVAHLRADFERVAVSNDNVRELARFDCAKLIVDANGASAPIILPPDVFRPRTPDAAQTAPTPDQSSQAAAQPAQPPAQSAQPGAGQ